MLKKIVFLMMFYSDYNDNNNGLPKGMTVFEYWEIRAKVYNDILNALFHS
jgi:hypothetical protein